MNFELNDGQKFIVDQAIEWFNNSSSLLFQYDGPPGSGKSVVLNEIVRRLGLDVTTEVAAMSFIGAASLVMRTKGLVNAKTAHSWCYETVDVPMKDEYGNFLTDKHGKKLTYTQFFPKKDLPKEIKLIIIDEAYCMPASMRPVIESFGRKVLACGDQNQLPPVKDKPAYLASGYIFHLTEIMRQTGVEDIAFIAGRAMRGLPLLNGYYGHSMVVDREDVTDAMLLWADVIICCTNKTRDKINKHVRYISGYSGILPNYGERLVCRNNNWNISERDVLGNEINLVNGLLGVVTNQPDVSDYNKVNNTFTIKFRPDLAQDIEFTTQANYDYMTADNDTRLALKNSRHNKGALFEFGYCITCHIAQGSQFHKVIYIEESMGSNIQSCLNLVGPTRADQQLIYVKNNYRPWIDYNDPDDIRLSNYERIDSIKNKANNKKKWYKEKY